MEEIWKDIKGYEGLYQVSNWGRVKSLLNSKERILKSILTTKGYLRVGLYKDSKQKNFFVHRLVAQHFIPNPYNLSQVNHKDENKLNNIYTNLEWCNNIYNSNYGSRNERISKIMFNGKQSKPVLQYDLNGNLIKEWSSTRECGRNKYDQGAVASCCRGEKPQYKGFIWRYKE